MTSEVKPPIVGLDVGTVRIGIALSDQLHLTARTLRVLERQSLPKDLAALEQLVREQGAETIVVGWPRTLKGGSSSSTQMAERFAEALRERMPEVAVELWDERFSTVQAEETLIETGTRRRKRKQKIDMVAAAVILQNYLDRAGR